MLGRRIAEELHAQGSQIDVLGPASMSLLFQDAPLRYHPVEPLLPALCRTLPEFIHNHGCESVCLLDIASVFLVLKDLNQDSAFLSALDVPVFGLDVWDLATAGLCWDLFGQAQWQHSASSQQVTRRLLSAPIASPTRPGAYDALPRLDPLASARRLAVRQELGAGDADRILLFTTAKWQMARNLMPGGKRLARVVPPYLARCLSQLGPGLRLVHIGPEALEMGELGCRYIWLPQVSPARFHDVLGAADALLSLNVSATTIAAALAIELPVILCMNSYAGSTADELLGQLPRATDDTQRQFLTQVAPLYPFWVWPLGLFRFLSPVLAQNPYLGALRTVELLDPQGLRQAVAELLFDPQARQSQLERQALYCAGVRQLPSASQLLQQMAG